MSEISTLIHAQVNKHGQLHLDGVQTAILIRWLESVESTLREQAKLLEQLQKLILSIQD